MSALPWVNAGPVLHTPGAELMSRRKVVVLFANGTLGCSPLYRTELSPPATPLGPVELKPPTTYRYCPTSWYPASRKAAGAAVPADQVLVATSYTCTVLTMPVVPPATNTFPLNAPEAEP